MTKNELITALLMIDGNPEITIWNGMVNDFNHINPKIETIELVRETLEASIAMSKGEYMLNNNIDSVDDLTEEALAEIEARGKDINENYRDWAIANMFHSDEVFDFMYGPERKPLIVLNPLPRGKSTWDRHGTINY